MRGERLSTPLRIRFQRAARLGFAAALLLAGGPALAGSADAPAQRDARYLTVLSSGSLPGFSSAEVPAFLTRQMAAAPLEAWRFEPVAADFTPPADRVEWSFRVEGERPAVATASKPPAVSLSAAKSRFVARRMVFIELRLYLHDEFQTLIAAQADIYGGPNDAELAQSVQRAAQRLLGTAGAYPVLEAANSAATIRH